ncbi:MAG: hypothetical protein R3C29_01455 [Dehalococcoidia bacterium]
MHPSIIDLTADYATEHERDMTMNDINATPATRSTNHTGELIYRFEAQLGEPFPVGVFDDGIRFHNNFDGRISDGPFAGARICGLDEFKLRPDGVGEVVAPEAIDAGNVRASVHVRGYVVPPDGLEMPPLEAIATPGFEFPDLDFRFTGSATLATTSPEFTWLNSTIAILEGTVNMGAGTIKVEARAA